jgi:peptidoglycan/xylan/chitin deacetylase (PgdA/CDA1 family)
MWRRAVKVGSAAALAALGVDRLIGHLSGRRGRPLVLGYHRVVPTYAPDATSTLCPMQIDVRMLEAQIDWVGRHYRFVSLDELQAAADSGTAANLAAVTVDDGYRDAYEVAFPLFARKGIPAAFFVMSGLVGTREVPIFDRLYFQLARARTSTNGWAGALSRALDGLPLAPLPAAQLRNSANAYDALQLLLKNVRHEDLRPMLTTLEAGHPMPEDTAESLRSVDWSMLSAMDAAGMTIGSHTCRHVFLNRESSATVAQELSISKRQIEVHLRKRIRHFAYPAGEFTRASARAVAAAGYDLAYTICEHVDSVYPLLTIARRVLWQNSCIDGRGRFSGDLMSAHVNGTLDLFNPRCRLDHRPDAAAHARPQALLAEA